MKPYGWFFGLLLAVFFVYPSFACQPSSGVILEENFKDPERGWTPSDNASLFYGPSGAGLKYSPGTGFPVLNSHYTSDGTDLCMTIVWSPSPAAANETGVGVLFWAKDYPNYYTAQITNHGNILVIRRIADVNQRIFLEKDDKHPDLIHKDPGSTNEVEVQISGVKAILWVNGRKIFEIVGQPPPGSGYVGLAGSRTALEDTGGDPPTATVPKFLIRAYP
jgi:hypothetical protein